MSALRILCAVTLIAFVASDREAGFCEAPDGCSVDSRCPAQNRFTRKRYILYDVNPPEGFNLRRDVYVRVAVFLRRLIERDKEFQWQLVLPPWGNIRTVDVYTYYTGFTIYGQSCGISRSLFQAICTTGGAET